MLLPVIPLRDIVIFPAVTMPLYVGRARTLAAIAAAGEGPVLFVAQRSGAVEAPTAADLYSIGTMGVVLQQAKFADATQKLLVRGETRARLTAFHDGDYLRAETTAFTDPTSAAAALAHAVEALRQAFARHFGPQETMQPPTGSAAGDRIVSVMQGVLELPDLDAASRLERLRAALADQKSRFA